MSVDIFLKIQVCIFMHISFRRYYISSENFKGTTNKKVKYYDAEYTSMKIPDEQIEVIIKDQLFKPYTSKNHLHNL